MTQDLYTIAFGRVGRSVCRLGYHARFRRFIVLFFMIASWQSPMGLDTALR